MARAATTRLLPTPRHRRRSGRAGKHKKEQEQWLCWFEAPRDAELVLEQEAGSVKLQDHRVQVFRQALIHYLQQYWLINNLFKKGPKNSEVQYAVKLDGQ